MAAITSGPLAAFTPPPSCAGSTGINQIWTQGKYYYQNGPLLENTECFPSSYTGAITQYFSPAAECPSGYTPACTSSHSIATLTETAITCCPTMLKYTCIPGGNAIYAWQKSLGCTTHFEAPWTTTSVTVKSNGQDTVTSKVNESDGGIGALGIQIRYQQADLSSGSPATETSPGSKPTDGGGGGIGAGAAAGIGVGVALGVLALAGAAFFVWWRKRHTRPAGSPSGMGSMQDMTGQGGGGYTYSPAPASELGHGHDKTPQNLQELAAATPHPSQPHSGGYQPVYNTPSTGTEYVPYQQQPYSGNKYR